MKRLWLAAGLLLLVADACLFASLYQHRQIDRMLGTLDRLEATYETGDTHEAYRLAKTLATDYARVGKVLYCYVAHNDLAESQETAAVLPALILQGGREEMKMEIARLREQLQYLRGIDDPLWQNIL